MPELQDLPVTDAGVGEDAGLISDNETDNGDGPASQIIAF